MLYTFRHNSKPLGTKCFVPNIFHVTLKYIRQKIWIGSRCTKQCIIIKLVYIWFMASEQNSHLCLSRIPGSTLLLLQTKSPNPSCLDQRKRSKGIPTCSIVICLANYIIYWPEMWVLSTSFHWCTLILVLQYEYTPWI